MLMTQTMRWFGPDDPVTLAAIRQCGASGIVTALHEVPNGAVWSRPAIAARRDTIAAAGLDWTVVESLPIHEDVKRRGPGWRKLIDAYVVSIENLAACGIRTVTYNFMPLLDWTRTDLAWELSDGARALRFDPVALAAYDIHILRRPDAARDHSAEIADAAARLHASMTDEARATLERTIISGLPGSEESFSSTEFLDQIDTYRGIDSDRLRDNHVAFLEAVCPTAEAAGVRLVVHPDDPPFPLFGLPRVVSTEADVAALFQRVPSPANGLCFCAGSFSVRADNDLPGMVRRLGSRIGFVHLRSVQREPGGAFHEARHLEGGAEMAAIVAEIVRLSRAERRSIPMRPDHGHQMLDDLGRTTQPGYSLLGRMRGLAELRGLESGIVHTLDR